MLIIVRIAGIALVVAGLFLYLLIAVINPMTLKKDTAHCVYGYGTGSCGSEYGGLLPEIFVSYGLVFDILSILVAAFGAVILWMTRLERKPMEH